MGKAKSKYVLLVFMMCTFIFWYHTLYLFAVWCNSSNQVWDGNDWL